MKTKLSIFSVLLLVSACSTLQNNPLQDKTAVYSWLAQGKIHLQCQQDNQGFYWRFIESKGVLLNNKNKKIGTFTQEQIILQNGDSLSIHAQETMKKGTGNNLPDLLYITSSSRKNKTLTQITHMVRKNSIGGLPVTRCSPAQKFQVLSIPFSARYIFYR